MFITFLSIYLWAQNWYDPLLFTASPIATIETDIQNIHHKYLWTRLIMKFVSQIFFFKKNQLLSITQNSGSCIIWVETYRPKFSFHCSISHSPSQRKRILFQSLFCASKYIYKDMYIFLIFTYYIKCIIICIVLYMLLFSWTCIFLPSRTH